MYIVKELRDHLSEMEREIKEIEKKIKELRIREKFLVKKIEQTKKEVDSVLTF